MATNIASIETMDNTLRAKVHETRKRYFQDRTPDNRVAYRQALQEFADWAMWGQLKNDSPISRVVMTTACADVIVQ
jgi:hypothetical protein